MLFASHILEHLARDEFEAAVAEVHRVLKPGGRFRVIVPDLRERARRYLEAANPEMASDEFVRSTWLGVPSKPRGLLARIKARHGHSRHLWMWDHASLSAALRRHGFRELRRCAFGDANDPRLIGVERADRFVNRSGIQEVAIEAIK
jgi:SAM-dependent methyltransferase